MARVGHTPVPWKRSGHDGLLILGHEDDGAGNPVRCTIARVNPSGEMPPEVDVENAEFIVRAVNAHDELVAALRRATDALIDYSREDGPGTDTDAPFWREDGEGTAIVKAALDAIAKAEGK